MSNLHKSPETLAVEQQWRKQAQEAEAATVHGGAPNIDVTEIDNLKVPTSLVGWNHATKDSFGDFQIRFQLHGNFFCF